MSSKSVHIPVLLSEVTNAIAEAGVPGDRLWIDGTLGGAGHAVELVSLLGAGDCLVGFDRDPAALVRSESKLATISRKCAVRIVNASYREIPEYVRDGAFGSADAILLDLGLSSDQLEDRNRGFSFKVGGPLDLRFDTTQGISAAELLQKGTDRELADIIYQYGEERFSRRIARAIVEQRITNPIETAEQLADLVHRVVPGKIHGRIDSATRTFQALRIAVNHELEHLTVAMKRLPECLKPGGVLVVISFHSLEDRIVKHGMRDHPLLDVVTRKPILPTEQETEQNPRARSAKLRIAKRVF